MQGLFVSVRGRAIGQLRLEVVDGVFLAAHGLLRVEVAGRAQAQVTAQVVAGRALHADQQTAGRSLVAAQPLDGIRQQIPAAQVEIADAEIRPLRAAHGFAQGGDQLVRDVIEDSGHGVSSAFRRLATRPSCARAQAACAAPLACCLA